MFPEQTNPLPPTGQVGLLKVDKLRHSWFMQILSEPHLVPSSTSPGLIMPVEGSTPNELYQIQTHNFFNLLFIDCFTWVYLFAHTNDIVYIFLVHH